LFLLLLFQCRTSEPVLTGIPKDALLQESLVPIGGVSNANKEEAEIFYKPKENVEVDIAFLCGKPLSNVQSELEEQLGGFNGEYDLPTRDGHIRKYDRGEVRLVEGNIYMIRYALSTPMRRSDALIVSGFPEFVEGYLSTHREFILNNQWEFRRFRMLKSDENPEFVTHFEAWKWLPAEDG
jgi:hypothetical protein